MTNTNAITGLLYGIVGNNSSLSIDSYFALVSCYCLADCGKVPDYTKIAQYYANYKTIDSRITIPVNTMYNGNNEWVEYGNHLLYFAHNHPQYGVMPERVIEMYHRVVNHKLSNMVLVRTLCTCVLHENYIEYTIRLASLTTTDPYAIASSIIQADILHSFIYNRPSTATDIDIIVKHAVDCISTDKYDVHTLSVFMERGYNHSLSSLNLGSNGSNVLSTLSCFMYVLRAIKASIEMQRRPDQGKIVQKIQAQGGDTVANCTVACALLGASLGPAAGLNGEVDTNISALKTLAVTLTQ
jgi:ADP-ribosylglycohydrolase